jgi:hypothetical protein
MNANEFRIGNILYCTDTKQEFELNIYGLLGMVDGRRPSYEPIPLSPEILEKCGFYKFNNAWKLVSDKNKGYTTWIFTIWDNDGEYSYNSAEFNPVLTSLHQLQNLYFSLCGEELTYKQ